MVEFDIRYLLIPEMNERYNALSDFTEKVDFLFRLIDFDINLKEYADKINENWINETEERYSCEDYAFMVNEKSFITEYACKTNDDDKLFELINKLCNPEIYDYDTVISDAENSISVIANIDDFEFSDDENDTVSSKPPVRKTSLDVLLRFEPKK